jgi:hypothetical protein
MTAAMLRDMFDTVRIVCGDRVARITLPLRWKNSIRDEIREEGLISPDDENIEGLRYAGTALHFGVEDEIRMELGRP